MWITSRWLSQINSPSYELFNESGLELPRNVNHLKIRRGSMVESFGIPNLRVVFKQLAFDLKTS